MVARAQSGHLGTSFSCIDLVTWLHLEEMDDDDLYFSSKGHDAPAYYALLIGLGRLPFDLLHRLRRLDGLPGHPDVGTPNVVTNTGSLGMGISKAKGMTLAHRLSGEHRRIFVLTGDGELQEGQFWESLPSAVTFRLREVTVVVDHNKLQSDSWVEDVGDLGDLERKLESFGWAVARCDGHDPSAIGPALDRLRNASVPRALIADTVKGKGVSFMEPHDLSHGPASLYGFHSGAPTTEEYERALAEVVSRLRERLGREPELETVERAPASSPRAPQRLVGAYGKALVAAAEREPRLVALDADLVLDTGLVPFRERFPDRFFEFGIAEQDMVSAAGGLALRGLRPAVHSFACFLSARPNEQIYNNATEHTRILYVGSLAGLVPGGPGHSHQSVRDIAALGSMPGLTLIEPCVEAELVAALEWALASEGSTYLRLVSVPVDVPFVRADGPLVTARGSWLRPGRDVVFAGAGPVVLSEAWHAAELLEADGIDAGVLELPFLNRVDGTWLTEAVGGAELWVVDNHYVDGGQGSFVAAATAGTALAAQLRLVGIEEVPVCGRNDEVLRHHRLDAESLRRRVLAR